MVPKLLNTKQKYLIDHIDRLAVKYRYRTLPKKLAPQMLELYEKHLPDWCEMDGDDVTLMTTEGTVIANGFNRVVIGHYGPFIEFYRSQAQKENICCKKGQEYRFRDDKYRHSVKYFWYTAKDGSDVKIYFQQKGVTYADYKPDLFYVSPFEVLPLKH